MLIAFGDDKQRGSDKLDETFASGRKGYPRRRRAVPHGGNPQ
jgi:hypothetical protein